MIEQLLPYVDGDGVTNERQVYCTHNNIWGQIRIQRKTEGGKNYIRSQHRGPEERPDTNWKWVEVIEGPVF